MAHSAMGNISFRNVNALIHLKSCLPHQCLLHFKNWNVELLMQWIQLLGTSWLVSGKKLTTASMFIAQYIALMLCAKNNKKQYNVELWTFNYPVMCSIRYNFSFVLESASSFWIASYILRLLVAGRIIIFMWKSAVNKQKQTKKK